jgi:hypothetical protein
MNEPNKLAIDPKWERVERMTPTDESSTDWEATETSSVSTNEEPDW